MMRMRSFIVFGLALIMVFFTIQGALALGWFDTANNGSTQLTSVGEADQNYAPLGIEYVPSISQKVGIQVQPVSSAEPTRAILVRMTTNSMIEEVLIVDHRAKFETLLNGGEKYLLAVDGNGSAYTIQHTNTGMLPINLTNGVVTRGVYNALTTKDHDTMVRAIENVYSEVNTTTYVTQSNMSVGLQQSYDFSSASSGLDQTGGYSQDVTGSPTHVASGGLMNDGYFNYSGTGSSGAASDIVCGNLSMDISGVYTVSAWLNVEEAATSHWILSFGNGQDSNMLRLVAMYDGVYPGGNQDFGYAWQELTSGTGYPPGGLGDGVKVIGRSTNGWEMVSVVVDYDIGWLKMYRGTTLMWDAKITTGSRPNVATKWCFQGTPAKNYGQPSPIAMDNLAIWHRGLSTGEISLLNNRRLMYPYIVQVFVDDAETGVASDNGWIYVGGGSAEFNYSSDFAFEGAHSLKIDRTSTGPGDPVVWMATGSVANKTYDFYFYDSGENFTSQYGLFDENFDVYVAMLANGATYGYSTTLGNGDTGINRIVGWRHVQIYDSPDLLNQLIYIDDVLVLNESANYSSFSATLMVGVYLDSPDPLYIDNMQVYYGSPIFGGFSGSPNVTAPTNDQVVRGTEVNVTLGTRESNERINIAVNGVNVVANNTNTSQLDFTVAVPVGDVNVTVSSDDVGGEGSASAVSVMIKVSNLGAVTVTADASTYWVYNATPTVTVHYVGAVYTSPSVIVRLMNGSSVIFTRTASFAPAVMPYTPTVAGGYCRSWDGCGPMGQVVNATGDLTNLQNFQRDGGVPSGPRDVGGIEIYKWYNTSGFGDWIANRSGSAALRADPVELEIGQQYFIKINGYGYEGYITSSNIYSEGCLYAWGGFQCGAEGYFYISMRDPTKYAASFLGIGEAYAAATFNASVNDTLFVEDGVSSSVQIDAFSKPYFRSPLSGTVLRGPFTAQIYGSGHGLAAPTYTFEKNVTGSWLAANVSGEVLDGVGTAYTQTLSYAYTSTHHYYIWVNLTQPVYISYFDVDPTRSTVVVGDTTYPVVDGKAWVGKVFPAGYLSVGEGRGYADLCRHYHITTDGIFDWQYEPGWGTQVCGFAGVNYTTLDKVNVTVNPGTTEGLFNMRVRATDGIVVTNNSVSGGLQLVLDPELSNQMCPGTVYPNADDLPVANVVRVNFSVYAPLGFSSPTTRVVVSKNSVTTNGVCSYTVIDGQNRNYNCTAPIRYFYEPGSWNVLVNYTDGVKSIQSTSSGLCTVGETYAVVANVTSLSFPTAVPGRVDAPSNKAIIMRNTGNVLAHTSLKAQDLVGRQTPAVHLNASSFRAGLTLNSSVVLVKDVATDVNVDLVPEEGSRADIWLWLTMDAALPVQDYYSVVLWQVVSSS